ncbi:MAG: hypothetical protein JOZ33_08840, partial [Acidobacteriaceae bacterium]|nr:hypothetical protein [Acidobacteriaceae bacterium]
MPLPPFTWKSALLYLVGVAAVLVIVYLLIAKLMQTTPRHSITPRTTTSSLVYPPGSSLGMPSCSFARPQMSHHIRAVLDGTPEAIPAAIANKSRIHKASWPASIT